MFIQLVQAQSIGPEELGCTYFPYANYIYKYARTVDSYRSHPAVPNGPHSYTAPSELFRIAPDSLNMSIDTTIRERPCTLYTT